MVLMGESLFIYSSLKLVGKIYLYNPLTMISSTGEIWNEEISENFKYRMPATVQAADILSNELVRLLAILCA